MGQHPRGKPAPNSMAGKISAALDAALTKQLTVYGFKFGPGGITVFTQPLGESPREEDDADAWLRGKLGEGKTGGHP